MLCSFRSIARSRYSVGTWGAIQAAGGAKRKPRRKRSLVVGTHAHDDIDSAEVRGDTGDRLNEREKSDHIARRYSERKRNFVG
jgi:hypothetical protein